MLELCFILKLGELVQNHDKESSEVRWFPLDPLQDSSEFAFNHYDVIQQYTKCVKEGRRGPSYSVLFETILSRMLSTLE